MATYAVSHFDLHTQQLRMTQVTANSRIEAIRLGVESILGESTSSFENATDPERTRRLAWSASEAADAVEIV